MNKNIAILGAAIIGLGLLLTGSKAAGEDIPDVDDDIYAPSDDPAGEIARLQDFIATCQANIDRINALPYFETQAYLLQSFQDQINLATARIAYLETLL
jgi:hypothetical protein